jgi:hypothetical protein
MLIDEKWVAGVFDACGWVDTFGEQLPRVFASFRSRHRETLMKLHDMGCISGAPFRIENSKFYMCESHGVEFLSVMRAVEEHSPLPSSVATAKAAIFMYNIETKIDIVSRVTVQRLAEKIKEANDREYPV